MPTEMEPSKSGKKNHWVLLTVVFLLTIVALVVLRRQHESNSERWKNRETKRNNRDNEDQSNSESTQNFIEKGYSHRDIKQLKDWGFEASDVPDLNHFIYDRIAHRLKKEYETLSIKKIKSK